MKDWVLITFLMVLLVAALFVVDSCSQYDEDEEPDPAPTETISDDEQW